MKSSSSLRLMTMLFLGLFLLFASEPPANAQEALTNDDVIKMVAARMAPNLIVQMIQTQPGSYSLNPADIDQLQRQGVPKDIISAMQDKSPIMSKAPEAIQSNATQKKPGGPASEAGCPGKSGAYYLDGGSWKPMSQILADGSGASVRPIPFALSVKSVARFRDPVAPVTVGQTPKFCLATSAQYSRNIVIAALDVKSDYREIQLMQIKEFGGVKSGLPDKKLQPIQVQAISDFAVEVSTTKPLPPGQYMIFPVGQGTIGYDFGVQASVAR